MFATKLVIEMPIDTSVVHNNDFMHFINVITDEAHQQMYAFLKASVESSVVLNVVEESLDNTLDESFILEERFLSDTLESAQQFQNSTDFQQVFVQLFQSHGATVSVTTENDVTLDSGDRYATMYELVNISVPNLMWETQFPYSG
jgi:hypothetical protein